MVMPGTRCSRVSATFNDALGRSKSAAGNVLTDPATLSIGISLPATGDIWTCVSDGVPDAAAVAVVAAVGSFAVFVFAAFGPTAFGAGSACF